MTARTSFNLFNPFNSFNLLPRHRRHTARANRRMLRVRADVRLPVPATLAFDALGLEHADLERRRVRWRDFELRNIEQFAQVLSIGGRGGEQFRYVLGGQFGNFPQFLWLWRR